MDNEVWKWDSEQELFVCQGDSTRTMQEEEFYQYWNKDKTTKIKLG